MKVKQEFRKASEAESTRIPEIIRPVEGSFLYELFSDGSIISAEFTLQSGGTCKYTRVEE